MRCEKDGLSGIGDEYGNGNNGICGGAKSDCSGKQAGIFSAGHSDAKERKMAVFCGELGRNDGKSDDESGREPAVYNENRGRGCGTADGTDGCFAGGWYAGCNSEGERQTVFGG